MMFTFFIVIKGALLIKPRRRHRSRPPPLGARPSRGPPPTTKRGASKNRGDGRQTVASAHERRCSSRQGNRRGPSDRGRVCPPGVSQVETLKEENDSLRCQLDAYRNEVELLKQEQGKNQPIRSEEDTTHSQQLSFLQQALQGMQKVGRTHARTHTHT